MKKKLIIGACITLVVVLIVGTAIARNSQTSVRTVQGALVTKEAIGEEVFASGKLELSDKTEVNAPFSAKIKSVSVKVGDQVKTGQELFQLDTEDLRKQLDSYKVDLSASKTGLNDSNSTHDRSISQAKKAMDDARNTMNDTKTTMDDAKKKLDQANATSPPSLEVNAAQTQYEQAKQAYEQAKKASETAKQTYDNAVHSPAGTAQTEASIKKLQANINDTEEKIDSAVVKAPVDGTVITLNAVAGSGSSGGMSQDSASQSSADALSQAANSGGTSLVTISNTGKLKAKVKVNELDSPKIQAGQKVKVTCEAVGKDYSGSVDSIAPTAVTSTGTKGEETNVEVVINLDNSDGLKSGYNISSAIQVSNHPEALVVPNETITDRGGKKLVFVTVNGVAKAREVNVGITGETKTEITSGVKQGEKVILNPGADLIDGNRVKMNG